jgi:UDP-GlcNAc:undecaprenyl-phosphate GlcNAc-1-phosphate transferase
MPADMFAFATALFLSVSLTPAARQLALRLGVIDRPGPRKVHLTPIPLLGGLAIYTGAVLAIILFIDGNARAQVVGILAGATLLLIVGILDDRGLLHHQIKLLIAMPLAALILLAAGIQASLPFSLPHPFSILHSPLSILLTLLWVVGITAAFSILDHMDGLCAGITAVASAFFLLFAVLSGQVLVGTLAAAILGASLGFLRWNFNPAKIFMGDGGAMFLGFMMATLGLKLRFPELPQTTSWMIPVLILGFPIFDTTLVTISRIRRGLIPFASPGKDHTAHRLAHLGLGQRGAVLVLYALGVLFGLMALLVSQLSVWQAYALASIVTLIALLAIIALERAPYERQEAHKQSRGTEPPS